MHKAIRAARDGTPLTLALTLWRSLAQNWANRRSCEQDDLAADIRSCTKAVESNPNDARAYLDRGTSRHKASDYDNAIANFNKALELDPKCAAAYIGRGSVYYDKGYYHGYDRFQLQLAIADFTRAIEIGPESAAAHCNLGWAFEAIGNEREAIAHYRQALEIDPSLEAARDNLKLLGARH